jgi:hypothetical protein
MDVQTRTGNALEGLGHEGCIHAVFLRGCLDDALEQQCMLAGAQRIIDMLQVDLELAR